MPKPSVHHVHAAAVVLLVPIALCRRVGGQAHTAQLSPVSKPQAAGQAQSEASVGPALRARCHRASRALDPTSWASPSRPSAARSSSSSSSGTCGTSPSSSSAGGSQDGHAARVGAPRWAGHTCPALTEAGRVSQGRKTELCVSLGTACAGQAAACIGPVQARVRCMPEGWKYAWRPAPNSTHPCLPWLPAAAAVLQPG